MIRLHELVKDQMKIDKKRIWWILKADSNNQIKVYLKTFPQQQHLAFVAQGIREIKLSNDESYNGFDQDFKGFMTTKMIIFLKIW